MSATRALSRRSVQCCNTDSTVSHRGTRGSRALRRGRVNTSTGFRAILSRRTAHLPKLPNVASRTRMLLVCSPRAARSYWYARQVSAVKWDTSTVPPSCFITNDS
jgi:hypothetical protein